MIVRAFVWLALFAACIGVGRAAATSAPMTVVSVVLPPSPSFQVNEIGGLSFSESVNAQARPEAPAVQFSGDTMRIWISFNYYDYDIRSRPQVRYVITANHDGWQEGPIACCDSANGRYAFPIERERDRAFGGAGYQVSIYVGKVEASRGEFVVLGTGGFDNENSDEDDGFSPRGNLSNNANSN